MACAVSARRGPPTSPNRIADSPMALISRPLPETCGRRAKRKSRVPRAGPVGGLVDFFTFKSPLAIGMPCDVVFPMVAVRHEHMHQPSVKKAVFRKIMALFNWSITIAEQGIGPSLGFQGEDLKTCAHPESIRHEIIGKEIAGGFRACYTGVKHDTKAKMELHCEKQRWQCTWLCMDCFACKPGAKNTPPALNFKDFSPTAFWRSTVLSDEGFEAYWAPHELSPCFQIRGHSHGLAYWDWMHIVPLGILRDHCATHIWIWIRNHLVPEAILDRDLALRGLWDDLCGFCKEKGFAKPWGATFTLSSLGIGDKNNPEYPELGSAFKATAVTTIMRWIARKSSEIDVANTDHSKARQVNAWAMAELQFVLDIGGWLLNPREIKRAKYATNMYLMTWQFLANKAVQDNERLWKIRPKHYYFCHLMDRCFSDGQNPCKALQNAAEESYLGVVKRIGQRCHGASVYVRLLQRLLLFLTLRWKRRQETGAWRILKR